MDWAGLCSNKGVIVSLIHVHKGAELRLNGPCHSLARQRFTLPPCVSVSIIYICTPITLLSEHSIFHPHKTARRQGRVLIPIVQMGSGGTDCDLPQVIQRLVQSRN